jgi:hypothetical protein
MLADAARRARLSGLVPGFLAASLLKARRKSASGLVDRQARAMLLLWHGQKATRLRQRQAKPYRPPPVSNSSTAWMG